jgi:hypothetical protein
LLDLLDRKYAYGPVRSGITEICSKNGELKVYMNNNLAFKAVMRFLQDNQGIKVTATTLNWGGSRYKPDSKRNRFIKKLRNELGIWDQREIEMSDGYFYYSYSADWRVHTHGTESDPETYVESLRNLFAEV